MRQAKRRGLPAFASTPDVLPEFSSPKNVKLLSSLGILSEEEIVGHRDVFYAEYITKIRNEAACMLNMFNHSVSPAALYSQTTAAAALAAVNACGSAVDGGSLAAQTALLASSTKVLNDGLAAAAEVSVQRAQLGVRG